jgi:hypothetical protein
MQTCFARSTPIATPVARPVSCPGHSSAGAHAGGPFAGREWGSIGAAPGGHTSSTRSQAAGKASAQERPAGRLDQARYANPQLTGSSWIARGYPTGLGPGSALRVRTTARCSDPPLANTRSQPSAQVQAMMASVRLRTLGRSGMIVPSWARGLRRPRARCWVRKSRQAASRCVCTLSCRESSSGAAAPHRSSSQPASAGLQPVVLPCSLWLFTLMRNLRPCLSGVQANRAPWMPVCVTRRDAALQRQWRGEHSSAWCCSRPTALDRRCLLIGAARWSDGGRDFLTFRPTPEAARWVRSASSGEGGRGM